MFAVPATIGGQVAPPGPAPAARPAPDPDIFVAPLTGRGGRVAVGAPMNITARPGYDNQPSFTRNGIAILYTSVREDGQADIYRYDLRRRTAERLTRTPESEYSATVTPDGAGFSVVRVEADSTQRLWRFPLGGGEPALVLERVKPVGYHAWADDTTVLVFVLGTPPTLQRASTRDGSAAVVASAVGRSLQKVPGARAISFVDKTAADEWWVARYDVDRGEVTRLVRTPPGSEDHAWTPGGVLLMAKDSTLLRWDQAGGGWEPVATFREAGLRRITRVAVSPRGDRIALVGERGPP